MSNQKQLDRTHPKLRQAGSVLLCSNFKHERSSKGLARWRKWAKQKMSKRRRRHSKQIALGE
jgi:hypothetical protein